MNNEKTPESMAWEGVADIPLFYIAEDARNFYETEGGTDIEKKNAELMDSIKADGLMHPIVLRRNPEYVPGESGDEPFIIVSGHRRFIAYRRLCEDAKNNDPAHYSRYETIPATYVETDGDDLRARLMLLEANTTARDVTDWERAKAVEEYGAILDAMKAQGEELEGRRRDHIAAALGMSRTNVGRFENINKNLTGEYQEELKAGAIGVSVADKIASLPEEKQKELHDDKGADVKLADVETIKEKPVVDLPAPKDETPVVQKVRLDGIPKEAGYVDIIVAEQGGMFAGGYDAYTVHGGLDMDWKVSPKYKTYDEAFDFAVEQAKRMQWIADLMAMRPAEVNTSEDTSEGADGEERAEGNRIRLEGMRRAYAYLRKAANKFRQRADVEQQEGNEEEARYLNATADIFAELETVSFRSNVMETGADWGEFLDAATESTT